MDPATISITIGALATVVGGLAGGVASRSETWDRLISRSRFPRLAGTSWESTWKHDRRGQDQDEREVFTFLRQRKSRVFGTVAMASRPGMTWDIEGDYNDRFLRLFWSPAPSAENKYFLDYGCYFFERQGDGTFKGASIGYDAEANEVVADEHELKLLGSF